MKYAVGVTAIAFGAILIYSGFRDVPIWDNVVNVAKGMPVNTTATSIPANAGSTLGAAAGSAGKNATTANPPGVE